MTSVMKPPLHSGGSAMTGKGNESFSSTMQQAASPGSDRSRSPGNRINTSPGNISNNSPFREWATSNLSTFDNEILSPGIARPILSPSYSHTVKLEHSPIASHGRETGTPSCNDDRLESQMKRQAVSPFSPGFNPEFDKCMDPSTESSSKDEEYVKDDTEACDSSENPPIEVVRGPRPPLQICDLFTFEIIGDKVIATGFGCPVVNSNTASMRRGPLTSLPPPVTPGYSFSANQMDSSETKLRVCCCKKSRCLKLYCECFAAGELCRGCKCCDCANDGMHESERASAVEGVKQRNANAFAPKIVDEQQVDKGTHVRGCRCKKSHCLKKYCECFQAGVTCADKCKCEDCQNILEFDFTPRERTSESIRVLASLRSGSGSLPSASEERGECPDSHAGSPSPTKKPRMLDFNIMATPTSHLEQCNTLDQLTPDKRYESHMALNMLASPSLLQLPTQ